MTEKKLCIPIFFRRINDLQQFLPIIDFLKNKCHIILICLNENFKINSYETLNIYKKNKNVDICYLNDFLCQKNIFIKYLIKILKRLIFFRRFTKYIEKYLVDEKNLRKIFLKYNIKIAFFDFPITNENYRNLIKLLIIINIKIIGVHHGIWVRFTSLNRLNYKNFFLSQKKNSEIYDKIIVFNPEYKRNLEKLGCLNKFKFYGSFKDKWKKLKVQKIINKKKIKILYLDHSSQHGIIKSNVVKDLKIIKKLENIEVKIRPNTSVEFVKNNKDLDIFYETGLDENFSYENSSKLIQESDIIINPISSVIIEAFYFKKIVIHPNHHLKNDYLLWQRFKCCYEVKSVKGIIKIIGLFRTKKLKKKDYLKNCKKILQYLNGKKSVNFKLNSLYKEIIKYD